ncbi:hypothetical protein LFX25_14620 [Leptospira sp. FAT2]|uniref:hypothetical protein n=1 Tax=Leptospira sanjuanensis TaxID=2879643 RepID=UPI001EE97129|nr:hypothetical protein [Leptospira sanjuanensis]MCG6169075.1 hypothetical protein [Leptospira sanjuanensis]MCG6194475.1 hypothetical protein [Leptospira sanjuanensis]
MKEESELGSFSVAPNEKKIFASGWILTAPGTARKGLLEGLIDVMDRNLAMERIH